MLNPMMPDDVAVKPIPRQDWYSISEVYRFQHVSKTHKLRKQKYNNNKIVS